MAQLKQQDPQAPNIQLQTLISMAKYLGREILPGATNSPPSFSVFYQASETQIGQFGAEGIVQQNVFGLDVSMEDVLLVQRFHPPADLFKDERNLRVR